MPLGLGVGGFDAAVVVAGPTAVTAVTAVTGAVVAVAVAGR